MKITELLCKSLLIATLTLGIAYSDAQAQELSNKKVIQLKQGNGRSADVLDKTLWVRLKPGKSYSSFCSEYPDLKLTPLMRKPHKAGDNFQAPNALSSKIERMYILEYDSDLPLDKYIAYLQSENASIESVEPYYVYELLGSPESPNDPLYNSQISLDLVKAKEAFQKGLTGSPNITIGISDGGCDVEQEDLVGQLAYNTAEIPNNGKDDDNNGYIDDYAGYNFAYEDENTKPDYVFNIGSEHGMQVTSILASKPDNAKGIVGVGNQCKYFPLKIVYGKKVIYGYQSILYAAVRKFQVINCSWGRVNSSPYSQFEQDIIDYAISQGVCVVAAGGNKGISADVEDVYFPANYHGVLGVGATDNDKSVAYSASTLSLQTDILAPGYSLASTGYNFYPQTTDAATSYAAPVVSGFLGLIRAKYPELSAIEAMEFARVCTDDVTTKQPMGSGFFLPRFVNFLKALDVPPSEAISIRPISIEYVDANGNVIERLSKGPGRIKIKIKLRNYFAQADNLDLELSFRGYDKGVRTPKYKAHIDKIDAKSDYEFSEFEFIVDEDQPDFTAFRVDISRNGKKIDAFTFPAYFNIDYTTISNSVLSITLSDYGKFGFAKRKVYPNYISSFNVKGVPGLVARRSGVTLTINNIEAFTAGTDEQWNTDFTPVKTLTGSDKNVSILSLYSENGQKPSSDLSIVTKYTFPYDTLPILRIDFELINNAENFSGMAEIIKPALGMLFDWDIPVKVANNISSYFEKAVPDDANPLRTAAQITSNIDETHNVGMLVWTDESNTVAQCAGMPYSKYKDYKESLIPLFSNGVAEQWDRPDDFLNACGIKFNKTLQKGDKVTLSMLIAYSDNKNKLAKMLKNAYAKSSVIDTPKFSIYPNPASDYITLQGENEIIGNVEIINISGENVLHLPGQYTNSLRIDISHLVAGKYFIICGENVIGSLIKK